MKEYLRPGNRISLVGAPRQRFFCTSVIVANKREAKRRRASKMDESCHLQHSLLVHTFRPVHPQIALSTSFDFKVPTLTGMCLFTARSALSLPSPRGLVLYPDELHCCTRTLVTALLIPCDCIFLRFSPSPSLTSLVSSQHRPTP
jgi:hypothetical protein